MRTLNLLIAAIGFTAAQFPPSPEGVTYVKSKFHENVTLSFKEVRRPSVDPHTAKPDRNNPYSHHGSC